MCLEFQSTFNIDSDIYYKAISSVLANKPFSDIELQDYFVAEQKKEDFMTFSRSLADTENELYLPYEIDFILLGMDMNFYERLEESLKEELSENYGRISTDMRFKKIEIKDFIVEAKKLIANLKETKAINE